MSTISLFKKKTTTNKNKTSFLLFSLQIWSYTRYRKFTQKTTLAMKGIKNDPCVFVDKNNFSELLCLYEEMIEQHSLTNDREARKEGPIRIAII